MRHLPYFIVAAEEQHFQRAARRLGIAQSALSRRIKELEAALGDVPLFVRSGPRISLTPSGKLMLKEARRILAHVEEAGQLAAAVQRGETGVVHLGFTAGAVRHSFLEVVFAKVLAELRGFDFHVTVGTGDAFAKQLRSGELTAAIVSGGPMDDDIASVEFVRETYQLALAEDHPLAGRSSISLGDLSEETFLWYAKALEPGMHTQFLDALRSHDFVPRRLMESPSMDTTQRWVGNGVGVTFVPTWKSSIVVPGIPSPVVPGLVLKSVEDFSLELAFRLIWLRRNEASVLPRLLEAVREEMAKFD